MRLDTHREDDKAPTQAKKQYSSRTDVREPSERKVFMQEKIPTETEG